MTGRDKTLVAALTAIPLLLLACGPGTNYPYRATPTHPPMEPREVFVYAATATPTATATATPTATPTPTPTPSPTPTPEPPPPAPTLAPVQAAAAAPAVTGMALAHCIGGYDAAVHQWAEVARAYSWDICEWANIVQCESHGDAYAVNPTSGACGVMQHLPCSGYGDGYASIALGWEKYAERGWQPWTVGGCYPY